MDSSKEEQDSEIIKIALPKGRFSELSQKVFHGLGGKLLRLKALRASVLDDQGEIYFLNAADIPHLVSVGTIHCGISPDEWCLEFRHLNRHVGFDTYRNLKWISTKLAFFSMADDTWPAPHGVTVATSFPALTKAILNEQGIKIAKLLPLRGSVEACVPSLADIGFDCVETGKTLIANELNIKYIPYNNLGVSFIVNKSFSLSSHGAFLKLLTHVFDELEDEIKHGIHSAVNCK
jgi:ATP phosphoribosyltransferase